MTGPGRNPGNVMLRVSVRIAGLAALLLSLSACSSLQFYSQAIVGQSALLLNRRDLADALADQSLDAETRRKLQLVQSVRQFAGQRGLPIEDTFTTYVATGKRFIVWNVYAAPALSVDLKSFCYPVAGCVNYRGYFDEVDARAFASSLAAQGYDVYVGGIAAYSTLGWFSDPILDTFLSRSDEGLAALIFHELAHQVIYVPGDTRFNESFATAVEQLLLGQWLASHMKTDEYEQYLRSRARRRQVISLIVDHRERLREVYQSERPDSRKREVKQQVIDELRSGYASLSAQWQDEDGFSRWMAGDINNARIGTLHDYNDFVSAFTGLFKQQSEQQASVADLQPFFAAVRRLSARPKPERDAALEQLMLRQAPSPSTSTRSATSTKSTTSGFIEAPCIPG